MEIVVKRIAKMKTYTIGHLYLLKDEEVESRQSFSKENGGNKREFRDTFCETKLDTDHYFCDTLEPTWRNLQGITFSPEEMSGPLGRVERQGGEKDSGAYRHPRGVLSCARHPVAPLQGVAALLVQGVPDFEGIRIHAGNYPDIPRAASWWARTR